MRRAYGGSRCGDCVKTRCDPNTSSSFQRSQPKSKDPSGLLGGGGQDCEEGYQVSAKGRQEIDIPFYPCSLTLPLPSMLHVIAFSGRKLQTTRTVSICDARCVTQQEMLSAPLLQTLLSLPLDPPPEHFLLHLLLSKRLRSLISAL